MNAMWMRPERGVQIAVRGPDRPGAVDVEGRTVIAHDLVERHATTDEHPGVAKKA